MGCPRGYPHFGNSQSSYRRTNGSSHHVAASRRSIPCENSLQLFGGRALPKDSGARSVSHEQTIRRRRNHRRRPCSSSTDASFVWSSRTPGTPAADRKAASEGGGANKTRVAASPRGSKRRRPRREQMIGMTSPVNAWPALAYADWADTCSTLHLWTQIVGKIRLARTPLAQSLLAHAPLYVTTRGLSTSPIP